MRLRCRQGLDTPADYSPGERTDVELHLGHGSCRIKVGHRLAVLVSSSNFPHLDRCMNSLTSSALRTEFTSAIESGYLGGLLPRISCCSKRHNS